MKNIISFVVVVAVLLALTSAFAPQRVGLKQGKIAPEVILADSTVFSAETAHDEYILLHFWASYDALSRIANIRYSNAVEQVGGNRVRYIAVSYERNEALYGEIVKRDGVEPATQYYDADGEVSQVYDRYRLNKGFATYLIDAHGKIVAKNPTIHTIEKILGQ